LVSLGLWLGEREQSIEVGDATSCLNKQSFGSKENKEEKDTVLVFRS
jgi:hypothetical protein